MFDVVMQIAMRIVQQEQTHFELKGLEQMELVLGLHPTLLNFPEERSQIPVCFSGTKLWFLSLEQSKTFTLFYIFMLVSSFAMNCSVVPAELLSEDGNAARDSQGFR